MSLLALSELGDLGAPPCPKAANARLLCRRAGGQWLAFPDCRCSLPGIPYQPLFQPPVYQPPVYQPPPPQYYQPPPPPQQYYQPPPQYYPQQFYAPQQYAQANYPPSQYEYGFPDYSYANVGVQPQQQQLPFQADTIVDPTVGSDDVMGLPADYKPANFSNMAPLPTIEQMESTPVSAPEMRSGSVAQDTIGDAIFESNGDGLFGLGRFLG